MGYEDYEVTEVVTSANAIKLAVGLANPNLLPPVAFSVHLRDGMFSVFLTEEEARRVAANLIAAADEHDEENSRRGEQHDEMRLEA